MTKLYVSKCPNDGQLSLNTELRNITGDIFIGIVYGVKTESKPNSNQSDYIISIGDICHVNSLQKRGLYEIKTIEYLNLID
jgi:hypothetical protein